MEGRLGDSNLKRNIVRLWDANTSLCQSVADDRFAADKTSIEAKKAIQHARSNAESLTLILDHLGLEIVTVEAHREIREKANTA